MLCTTEPADLVRAPEAPHSHNVGREEGGARHTGGRGCPSRGGPLGRRAGASWPGAPMWCSPHGPFYDRESVGSFGITPPSGAVGCKMIGEEAKGGQVPKRPTRGVQKGGQLTVRGGLPKKGVRKKRRVPNGERRGGWRPRREGRGVSGRGGRRIRWGQGTGMEGKVR